MYISEVPAILLSDILPLKAKQKLLYMCIKTYQNFVHQKHFYNCKKLKKNKNTFMEKIIEKMCNITAMKGWLQH